MNPKNPDPTADSPELLFALRGGGWAPGNYIVACMDCGPGDDGRPRDWRMGDKRSWRCRPCAEKSLLAVADTLAGREDEALALAAETKDAFYAAVDQIAACSGCGLPYSDDGFADLVVPADAWRRISPTGNDGGLLCPTCLVRVATRAGVRCHAAFRSGPFCRTGADYRDMVAYARALARKFGPTSLTTVKFNEYADAIEELASVCDEATREAEHWRAVADCEEARADKYEGLHVDGMFNAMDE